MHLLIMRNQSKILLFPLSCSLSHAHSTAVTCVFTALPKVDELYKWVLNSYQASDLVKLDVLLNGQPVDAMATIVHRLKAPRVGRELVEKLKKFIDRFTDTTIISR